ncbi:hypothetical protein D3C72_2356820 [compost metagenome]
MYSVWGSTWRAPRPLTTFLRHVTVETKFSSPKAASSKSRMWWVSLSSMLTKITPSSRKRSRATNRRGQIMESQLACRRSPEALPPRPAMRKLSW